MKLDQIKKLIAMVEESEINEITIEEDGARITIRKGIGSEQTGIESRLLTTEEAAKEIDVTYPDSWKSIVAPMVGTFYRAPNPDSEPFVEEGDEIEEGQAVCILEAMKLMNEITAEEKGIVRQILVENGHSVEYGQELLLYEPA